MKALDVVILFVYLAGIVWFGSSFYRKNRTSVDFTLGSNKLPAWVLSLSIFATYVSSISYLAIPGQAYSTNWNAFAFSVSLPLATWMSVKYFVPLYRSVGSPSAYTYLEIRFGKWARIYASSMYLLTQLMRTGTILYLMAMMLHVITGWNIAAIILVTGLSVTIYAVAGGLQAVVWTDAVQGIILVAGALVSAGVLLFSMPEGPGQLFSLAIEHHKFSLGTLGPELDRPTFWVVLIYGIAINLQNYGIDQNYVQRYMAAGSDKDARNSVLYGGLLYIPVSMIFLFIGTALFSYYKANPGLLPAGISGDKVFPYFIVNGLPAGLTGLLIASVFAAGMSTVSTSINSSATIILNDYMKKPASGNPNERSAMRILFTASLMFSLLGILVAFAMIDVQYALDSWWKLASVFSGGMLGLFLLGYFTKHIGNCAAMAGVGAGVLLIGWMSLSPVFLSHGPMQHLESPFHGYLSIVFGTMAIFLVGFLAGILINQIKKLNINSV